MHIKRCLVDRYRKNECSPMDYFEFVIDPDSFAKTVENMFHVSFLIKVSEEDWIEEKETSAESIFRKDSSIFFKMMSRYQH